MVRVLVLFGVLICSVPARADTPVDFSRDILPILSDKCYHCHGPDEKVRKAELRFDTKAGAFRVLDGAAVIVPGKSAESELVARITSADPDEVMPPKSANRDLSPQQIELLKRWIDQGAKWGTHWAFQPPQRPDLPAVKQAEWVRNGIDRFVLAKLEQQGLQPAPPAAKTTLIRRLTLDLTGLPPTPAEVDAFVADESPQAYERLVDRLLDSPRFGERMAVDWLDIARYADTHGYQFDRFRPVWPYRDWVIQAFNQNLPFDQFVTWQLAGDLLPQSTKTQRLATAFNRLHMQNEEGGVVEEEFRVAYVTDRVNTMGTAFLGLTFECCRCHDHKYDPLSQKEFYSLFSFFQNIDESGQTSYFTGATPVPTLLLSDDATDARLELLTQQIAAWKRKASQQSDMVKLVKIDDLLTRGTEAPPPTKPVAEFRFEKLEANKLENSIDPAKPANAVEGPTLVPGKIGQALALNGDNGVTFPGIGHFTRIDPFSLSLWLKTPTHAPRMVVVHHSRAPIDAGSRGYELLLEQGQVAFGLHHMWPGNSLKVRTKTAVPINAWTHVTVTYDGSSEAAGVHIHLNGQPAELEIIRDGLTKDITYGGEPDLAIGYRFRDNGFKGGEVDEFQVFNRELTRLEAASLAGRDDFSIAWTTPADKLTEAQQQGLREFYLATEPPRGVPNPTLHDLRREHNALINPIPEIMVMKELPQPKPAYVLKRGEYNAPGEAVTANTPAALPAFPADQPRNRLGLAKWLLDPQHPLTARVSVNRHWQLLFGKGLVETSDNFGSQGAQPTHPELLDWLAVEFSSGSLPGTQNPLSPWDIKKFLKLIVMSATYQQSSVASAQLQAEDPGNHWLARGPSKKLTAEMLRDSALLTGGLLVEKLGGPSVKPYQPPGLWAIAMGQPVYDQGHGDDLHRRSLYTFWKRTVPHPAMVTFDAAERNVCIARRQSTSTPLQALALLNDIQIVEAARFAAQRMLQSGGTTDAARVAWLFKTICGRPPTDKELPILVRLLTEQRELFTANRAEAAKLLTVGETKNDPQLDVVELAAGTVLAEAILNLDEAVMRR